MFTKYKILNLTLMPLTLLTSCATIINGTSQDIGIYSNPSRAVIYVDNLCVGNTPSVVSMSRSDNHLIRLELEGFEPYEMIFTKKMSNWVFGNIVFGGLIGVAIDYVSGGIYRLTPECLNAELLKDQMCLSKSDAESNVIIVMKADPSWEKVGNLIPKT